MADSFRADSFTPDAAPAQAPKRPAYQDTHGPVVGGILDTLGATKRPGARTPMDVLSRPRGALEHAAQFAVEAPLIAAAGMAAPGLAVPAAAARIGAAGALGGLKAFARGDDLAWGALVDALTAGVSEGALKALPSVKIPKITGSLHDLGARVRGFEWATRAPKEAMAVIKDRLAGAGRRFNLPALSDTKLTLEDAITKLATTTGAAYRRARAELVNELNRLDLQAVGGPKPLAGAVFKDMTAKKRFAPNTMSRVANQAERGLAANPTRGVADAASTQKMDEGQRIPVGLALVGSGLEKAAEKAGLVSP